jgi:hypothetical protein
MAKILMRTDDEFVSNVLIGTDDMTYKINVQGDHERKCVKVWSSCVVANARGATLECLLDVQAAWALATAEHQRMTEHLRQS